MSVGIALTSLGGERELVLLKVIKWKGMWPKEDIHVKFCRQDVGQEEPGNIMRVKLATGSCPEQKSSNCPHQSKIKVLITSGTLKKPINPNLMCGRA